MSNCIDLTLPTFDSLIAFGDKLLALNPSISLPYHGFPPGIPDPLYSNLKIPQYQMPEMMLHLQHMQLAAIIDTVAKPFIDFAGGILPKIKGLEPLGLPDIISGNWAAFKTAIINAIHKGVKIPGVPDPLFYNFDSLEIRVWHYFQMIMSNFLTDLWTGLMKIIKDACTAWDLAKQVYASVNYANPWPGSIAPPCQPNPLYTPVGSPTVFEWVRDPFKWDDPASIIDYLTPNFSTVLETISESPSFEDVQRIIIKAVPGATTWADVLKYLHISGRSVDDFIRALTLPGIFAGIAPFPPMPKPFYKNLTSINLEFNTKAATLTTGAISALLGILIHRFLPIIVAVEAVNVLLFNFEGLDAFLISAGTEVLAKLPKICVG